MGVHGDGCSGSQDVAGVEASLKFSPSLRKKVMPTLRTRQKCLSKHFMICQEKPSYILPSSLPNHLNESKQLLAACCLECCFPVVWNASSLDCQKRAVLPLARRKISSWQHCTGKCRAHKAWCGRGFRACVQFSALGGVRFEIFHCIIGVSLMYINTIYAVVGWLKALTATISISRVTFPSSPKMTRLTGTKDHAFWTTIEGLLPL